MNSQFCITYVEWRQPKEDLPEIKDWPRNLTCPQANEVRWCGVWGDCGPIKIEVGATVWLLWQSWNALFNGYRECAQELESLTLIQSKILETAHVKLKKVESLLFLRVECLQIIRLAEIPQLLPQSPPLANVRTCEKTTVCAETSNFIYKEGCGQVFDWQIELKEDKTQRQPPYLLLSGVSLYDWATIENRQLLWSREKALT